MNRTTLSSTISALLYSLMMVTTPVLSADLDANKADEKKSTTDKSRNIEIYTETFVADDAGVFFAQAPDVPQPPRPPRPPNPSANFPTPPLPPLPPIPDIDTIVSSSLSEAFAGLPANLHSRTIKNAPYSAEIISERMQTLADGNQIVKRTSQMSYRDSAGRTRIESYDPDRTRQSVTIFDAMDGSRYVLNPTTKSATKISTDSSFRKLIEELRERTRGLLKNSKTTTVEGGTPGEQVIIHRTESTKDASNPGAHEDITVRVFRSDGTEPMAVTSGSSNMMFNGKEASITISGTNGGTDAIMSSPLGTSLKDRAWSSKATTKELGFRDFDGVRAEGKLRSYTIPAGEIGNKNPITVSTETWTSPELQITVYSKHSDPRTGDAIYRLAKVNRNEQPMSLFTVPDGYTVKPIRMPSISVK
jgi:hypothetical protein